MSLKRYDVEINGVQTTVQLSDEDAEAQGLTGKGKDASGGESDDKDDEDAASKSPKSAKQAAPPANKGAADK